ncbi:hypothetical protein GSI_03109 [Ganoderma sinense ZZ0214-1]|uniref:Uncharacterized protein n=1 Tax=Ganoderma sinense ZZ0214-1 TaxID=1077348 RepID=A0A2G8SKN8_9APHY|nr:hypothetical protein GSI_03109 [Ganoderma sinense ZZ0214-1]
MSSMTRISRDEALVVLDDQRAQVETFCQQLLGDEQEALRPLGFPKDPDQWHKSVPSIIRRLNLEYRHDCKFDVIEGARKIRRTHVSLDELMERLAACREMRATITELDSEFQDLCALRMPQLSLALVHHFAGIMPTIAASVALVHELVDSADQSISACTLMLEVMTMSKFRIWLSIPAPEFRVELAEYSDLLKALEDQETTQQDLLKQAKTYFDSAASLPKVVVGLRPGTFLDVASLRGMHVTYSQILEDLKMLEKVRPVLENDANPRLTSDCSYMCLFGTR